MIKKIASKHFGALNRAYDSFSFKERFFFGIFAIILSVTTLLILGSINNALLVDVPAYGGKLTEGIIGTPRFINPILAVSDADRDLTALVYSGLLRATPEGRLIPELAESFSISPDGLQYEFILKEGITFHDGEEVTTDDVAYTIALAQDSTLKSPKRANWEDVSVEVVDKRTITFTLKQAYSPFLENTTIGIIPRHIWSNVSPEQFQFSLYNVEPIGTGPYRIRSVSRDRNGIPTVYELSSFKDFALGEAYISKLVFNFYTNEIDLVNAFRRHEIDNINSVLPATAAEEASDGQRVERYPLPRVFGIFFNQNHAPVLTHNEVRRALDLALDKEKIVSEVLAGYGIAIDGPLPHISQIVTDTSSESVDRIEEARGILTDNGWKVGDDGVLVLKTSDGTERLSFTIATSNAEELKEVSEMVRNDWEQLGVEVELAYYEIGNLNQDIIRPREYDALLFGQIVGRTLDPFAFWHSSQRNDPGLNVALYTNITTDNILEKIRVTANKSERDELYSEFNDEIKADRPAVFLYAPDFIYILDEDIKGLKLGTVTTPSERFLNVYEWHLETDKVWEFLSHK